MHVKATSLSLSSVALLPIEEEESSNSTQG